MIEQDVAQCVGAGRNFPSEYFAAGRIAGRAIGAQDIDIAKGQVTAGHPRGPTLDPVTSRAADGD